MSILLTLLLLGFLFFLFSQFGAKLSAGASLIWWLISLFLVLATILPYSLTPIAHLLGVQLPSNLILGGLILFLLFLSIQEAAISTSLSRKLRDTVTTLAAREFESVLRGRRPGFIEKPGDARTALVILPAFNEESNIEAMAKRMKALPERTGDTLIDYCFVDDGSHDRTASLLRKHAPGHYTSHISNTGVAGVILTGFKIAKACDADYVIQCDSDGQHPVEEIPALVSEAIRQSADLLVGSRFVNRSRLEKHESTTRIRQLGSILLHKTLSLFGPGSPVRDPTSGFRVYSGRAIGQLIPRMPDEYPEPESLAILQICRARISEHPVSMIAREGGESSLGGLRGARFMIKVLTALLGLRLRTWRW